MRLPTPLLRRNPYVHKNSFGHVLILSGSARMLGAGALSGLAAMRTGAGLVTLGVPESLNLVLQKKISPVLMTLPLKETPHQTISFSAFEQLKHRLGTFQVIAAGPGLSREPSTKKFIYKIIEKTENVLVLDADALTAVSQNLSILAMSNARKILTPHPGEMARLTSLRVPDIEKNREQISLAFAKKYCCVILLKGHRTVVASPEGKIYINKTGNAGMAKAGSGDVLTGMIAALSSQGVDEFTAAKTGAFLHGRAGDLAAKKKTMASMIASDIIDCIPLAIKTANRNF